MKIAPEQIHLDDFASLVSLLAGVGPSRYTPGAGDAALSARLDERFDDLGAYLDEVPH